MRRATARQMYEGVLPAWKVDLILERARKKGFFEDHLEDVLQELALFVLEFRYDPQRAQGAPETAVLSAVLDLKLLAMRRTFGREGQRIDTYRDDHVANRKDHASPESDPNETYALTLDVLKVVSKLSPLEQRICCALSHGLMHDQIVRTLHISQYRVKQILADIRKRFVESGVVLEGSPHA